MTSGTPNNKSLREGELVAILVALIFMSWGLFYILSFLQARRSPQTSETPETSIPQATQPVVPSQPSPLPPPAAPSDSGAEPLEAQPPPEPQLDEVDAAELPRASIAKAIASIKAELQIDAKDITAAADAFGDLPKDHFAYQAIGILAAKGIANGQDDGNFYPERPITRAQLAAFLRNALETAETNKPLTFSDVPADFWGLSDINRAVDSGFFQGYDDGRFKPDLEVPRYQVLVVLASGAKFAEPAEPERILAAYRDFDKVPAWARPKVAAAVEKGIVAPDGSDLLDPETSAKRGEVAVMLYRTLRAMGKISEPLP